VTVIQFPPPPSDETVLSAVYKLQHEHPGWTVELCRADDGAPYVVASALRGGRVLAAHWGTDGWAIADHFLRVLRSERDLFKGLHTEMVEAARS